MTPETGRIQPGEKNERVIFLDKRDCLNGHTSAKVFLTKKVMVHCGEYCRNAAIETAASTEVQHVVVFPSRTRSDDFTRGEQRR